MAQDILHPPIKREPPQVTLGKVEVYVPREPVVSVEEIFAKANTNPPRSRRYEDFYWLIHFIFLAVMIGAMYAAIWSPFIRDYMAGR